MPGWDVLGENVEWPMGYPFEGFYLYRRRFNEDKVVFHR